MNIETKFFGMQEIDETEVIYFSHGIPGFEGYKKYVIIKFKEDSMFYVLQSTESPQVALTIIELEKVVPGYTIDLPNELVEELKLKTPEEAVALAVVTIPPDVRKTTVNLAAPMLINLTERIAKQVILDNPNFGLKHPLFETTTEKSCLQTAIK